MKRDTNNVLNSIIGALIILGFAMAVHADQGCEFKCRFEDNYEACMNECSKNDNDSYDDNDRYDQSCEFKCNDHYDECSSFCLRAFKDHSEACIEECDKTKRICVRACQDSDDRDSGGGDGGGGGGCFINSVTCVGGSGLN